MGNVTELSCHFEGYDNIDIIQSCGVCVGGGGGSRSRSSGLFALHQSSRVGLTSFSSNFSTNSGQPVVNVYCP